ncbi:hypothetical protein pdam_00025625, partial [Pocillopora damicornis]
IGDKHGEGDAYGNLGNAYFSLGDFKKALEYNNQHLKIAKEIGDNHGEEYHNLKLKISKEVGDKHGEGVSYGNLGNVYDRLGDKHGEGVAYCNLGNAYHSLGDLKKAIEYQNLHLKIAKEVGDKSSEAMAYFLLGRVFELQGGLPKAVEHYQASINLLNSLRVLLKSKDEWKVNFRNQHQMAYTGLWRVLVEQ